jgi:hypothetical protein
MRSTCVALIASSMLIAPAVLAQEVVIDPGVGPVFDTYYQGHKVRTYEGDIAVGADVPADYELAQVPDVVVTKYPKLKKYRYVRNDTIEKAVAAALESGGAVIRCDSRCMGTAKLEMMRQKERPRKLGFE